MKRLVVCFDGTWNNADNATGVTNVTRLSQAIHAFDAPSGVLQSVLYLRGVGTTGLDINKWVEGAIGYGIDETIRSGYMFLAQNYTAGDEIYLFGFSRGAFSARSLVGLIAAAGLLKRQSLGLLSAAWDYYRTDKPHSPDLFVTWAATQKLATPQLHADAAIDFLGVWDTVGALGVPGQVFSALDRKLYGFYDTGICPIIRHARHALAIDEHRDPFVPTLWTGAAPAGVDVKQTWFAGVHADVGGGYPTHALSDIPLAWMAREARRAGRGQGSAGLVFDPACLPDPAKLEPLAPQHDSSSGLFTVSHFVPTFRAMCGETYAVPFNQRLYVPTDAGGHRLPTINESVHESVLARWGKPVTQYADGSEKASDEKAYAPSNLAHLFADGGGLQPGIAVER